MIKNIFGLEAGAGGRSSFRQDAGITAGEFISVSILPNRFRFAAASGKATDKTTASHPYGVWPKGRGGGNHKYIECDSGKRTQKSEPY